MTEAAESVPYCSAAPCGTGWTADVDGLGTWLCNGCGRPSKAVYEKLTSKMNTNHRKSQEIMAAKNNTNTNIDLNALLNEVVAVIQKHTGDAPVVSDPPAKSDAKAKDDAGVEEGTERRAELEAMTVAALRKLAVSEGFDKDEVKAANKKDIVESLLDDDDVEQDDDEDDESDADAGDDAEADDADEDDEEGPNYTEDDLAQLGLVALKKIAKTELDYTTEELKGLDKEDVRAIILSGDEDVDDEDDEDEDDDEDDAYTEDDLQDMSLAEIKALCKEYGVKVKPGMKKKALIDAFFEDDEDDD